MATDRTTTPPQDITTDEEIVVTGQRMNYTLGFNISDFRSSINNTGILRSNQYMVLFTPPPMLRSFDTSQLTLRCDSVNLPGLDLMTLDGIYRHGYGPAEKFPHNVNMQEVTMTFIVDKAASQFTFFNVWLNRIYNLTDFSGGILGQANLDDDVFGDTYNYPFEVAYREEYATNLNMFVYNEQMDRVIEMNFIEAWPRAVQDTPLSWGVQDQSSLVRLQVSFCYKSFFQKTLEGYPKDVMPQILK